IAETIEALERFTRKATPIGLEERRARYLAGRLRDARAELQSVLDRTVLSAVPPGEMTESVAQVFSDHPAYSRFARLARLMTRRGAAMSGDGELEVSLRRSYDVFELYCLYRLMDEMAAELGPAWRIEQAPLEHSVLTSPRDGIVWSAHSNDGLCIELLY